MEGVKSYNVHFQRGDNLYFVKTELVFITFAELIKVYFVNHLILAQYFKVHFSLCSSATFLSRFVSEAHS